MAITRSVLRTKIRNKLKDWWIDQDTNSAYLSAAALTLTATTSGSKFHEGDIIECADETMKVTSVSSNNVTVIRGYKGTTAANHSASTALYIVDNYTSDEINYAIQDAFKALHPYISEPYVDDIQKSGNRITLDECDATTGWSQGGDGSAAVLDTNNEKVGSGCLDLGATYSSGSATYTKTITSIDASTANYLNFWVYVEDKMDSSDDYYYDRKNFLTIRLGNDSSNYVSKVVSLDEIKEGEWTLVSINIQDMTETGTWDETATDYLYLAFADLKSITSGDLRIDEFYLTTYPMSTWKLKYRLPKNVFRICNVRIYDAEDSDNYVEENRWYTHGDYIVFRRELEENKPMQLIGDKFLTIPSSDSTTIDLDERREEVVVLYSAIALFDNMTSERVRFTRYSNKLNKTDMSLLDVIRSINHLRSRYNELINQWETAGGAVEMDYKND